MSSVEDWPSHSICIKQKVPNEGVTPDSLSPFVYQLPLEGIDFPPQVGYITA